jgi:hypothetical protein
VCRRAHGQLIDLGRQTRDAVVAVKQRRLSTAGYYARTASLTQQTAAVARTALSHLRELPRPRDARLTAYFALATAETRLLDVEASALRGHRLQTVRQLSAGLARLGARVRKQAKRYGFHVCGGR